MFLRVIVALSFLLVASMGASNSARANWADAGYDRGGMMTEYQQQIELANSMNVLVPIYGRCDSACTMKLGARNVCVSRDASLFFHSAFNVHTHEKFSLANDVLMASYPPRIRRWVIRHHALDSVEKVTHMSGREAIALGIPECRKNPQSVFWR